jgi:hypothetical protein
MKVIWSLFWIAEQWIGADSGHVLECPVLKPEKYEDQMAHFAATGAAG